MQFLTRMSALALVLFCAWTVRANPSISLDLSSDHCAGDLSTAPVCMMTTWYASPNGGTNAAGSRADPLELQSALNAMSGGDVLILLNGTYNTSNEFGVYFRSGTASQPTTVRAENRWGAKIRGDGQYSVFTVQNSDHVVIDGLDVGPQSAGSPSFDDVTGIRIDNCNYVTVRNCFAHDVGCNGIASIGSDYITFEYNVARDNAKKSVLNCSGFSIYQPKQLNNNGGYHMVIRGNVAFENEVNLNFVNGGVSAPQPTDGNGIIIDDFNNSQNNSQNGKYTAATLVENNLCFNNGGCGIKVYESENVMVRNNTLWHNLFILRFYPIAFAELDFSYTASSQLTAANNIVVASNLSGTNAFSYDPQSGGNGYLQRYNNVMVGNVRNPGDTSFDVYGDDLQPTGQQDHVQFANATNSLTTGFGSVNDFDAYFSLTGGPGVDGAFDGDDYLGRALAADVDIEQTARPQGGAKDVGCYEGSGGFADDIISVNAPSEVSPGETFDVTVQYSSSGTYDVAVKLQDVQNGYALQSNTARQTVSAGTGTITFSMTAKTTIPIANNRFQFQTVLTEVGDFWGGRKDNLSVRNVSAVGAGDAIVSVDAPSEFSPGETFDVTVQYSASERSDIAVRLQDVQQGYARRATEGRQTVNAGTGTITFTLTANSNVAPAQNRYQFQTVVTEVGDFWAGRRANLSVRNVSCVGLANAVTSLNAPSSFRRGETFDVTVSYSAAQRSDIAVQLQDPQNSYRRVASEGRQTVDAGTGTITFRLTANNNVPIANNRYNFQSVVTPVGSFWGGRYANRSIQNVSCLSGSGLAAPDATSDRLTEEATMELFPNPTEGDAQLVLSNASALRGASCQVHDMTGRVVFRQALQVPAGVSRHRLNLAGKLPQAGLYLVRVLDGAGLPVATQRLVVR